MRSMVLSSRSIHHQSNTSASVISLVGVGVNPRYGGLFGVATNAGAPSCSQEHGRPLPTGPHGRGLAPDTHGQVHGARDPRLLTLPPRGAGVDVTPNLVWIAEVDDRVQLLHDRGTYSRTRRRTW